MKNTIKGKWLGSDSMSHFSLACCPKFYSFSFESPSDDLEELLISVFHGTICRKKGKWFKKIISGHIFLSR